MLGPALALAALAACATGGQAPVGAQEPAAPKAPQPPGSVPPGFGTLKQDQFTVSLRSGALLVKVTPLTESVIRLAAPDTYTRLHALAESVRPEVARRLPGGQPQLFLVSLFSYQPDVPFQPEDLQLIANGRTLSPAAILPRTAGWGKQRLGSRRRRRRSTSSTARSTTASRSSCATAWTRAAPGRTSSPCWTRSAGR